MFRLKGNDGSEGFLPGRNSLSRQCRHQVNINIFKSCLSGGPVAFQKVLHGMNPPQILKLSVFCGLQPEAQTVDSRLPPCFKLLPVRSPRIHLCGNLRILRHIKAFFHRIQDALRLLRRKHGGGAASEKYGSRHIALGNSTRLLNLLCQSFHIALPLLLPRRKGEKIAVCALADAERNVNVKLQAG